MFGTYVLFVLNFGYTLLDVNLLNVVFMSSNVLLDPPTGYLADRYGQKKLYIAGQVCWGMGMFVYGFGGSLPVFALAEMIGAFGHSLMSGALDSWMTNHVGEEISHRTNARAKKYAQFVSAPSAILGAIIGAHFGLFLPWIIAGASSIFAALATYILTRSLPERAESEIAINVGFGSQIIKMPGLIARNTFGMLSHKNLRFTLIVTFVSSMTFQPFNMFWAPIFTGLAVAPSLLGVVWLGISGMTALGLHIAERNRTDHMGVAVAILAIGTPMLLTIWIPAPWGVVGLFLLHETGRGLLDVVIYTYSNRHIENSVRSESNSIRGSVFTLGAAIGLAISGVLTLWVTPLTVWGISGAVLLILAVYALTRKD